MPEATRIGETRWNLFYSSTFFSFGDGSMTTIGGRRKAFEIFWCIVTKPDEFKMPFGKFEFV